MKRLYLIITIMMFVSNVIAQKDTLTFYDLVQMHYDVNDSAEGGNSKQLERMYKIWAQRLAPTGKIKPATNAIYSYYQRFLASNSNKSTNSYSPNWNCLGPTGVNGGVNSDKGFAGRITKLYFDPSYNNTTNKTLYASAYGGLWRTTNNGDNWVNIDITPYIPTSSIGDIAVSYQDSNHIFITTGMPNYEASWWRTLMTNMNPLNTSGIFRSIDFGQTWEAINTGFIQDFMDGGTCRNMIINPNNENEIFVATTNGIYKTSDAMATTPSWTMVFDGLSPNENDYKFRGLAYKPNSNNNTIYCSGLDIYKSDNSGANWISMTNNAQHYLDLSHLNPNLEFKVEKINIAVTNDAPDNLYAYIVGQEETYSNSGSIQRVSYIFKLKNNVWTQIDYTYSQSSFVATSPIRMAIAVSNYDENEIYYGYTEVKKSINGIDFFPITQYNSYNGFHADVQDIKYPPVNTGNIYVSNDGGISIKSTSNNTYNTGWTFLNNGIQNTNIWAFDDSENASNKIIIGLQDDECKKLLNNGNWVTFGGGDGYNAEIDAYNNDKIYTKQNGGFVSYNFDLTNPKTYLNAQLPYWFTYTDTNDVSTTYYQKLLIAIDINYNPNNFDTYFPMSGQIQRKKISNETSGDTGNDIWETNSNMGWTGGLSDFEVSESEGTNGKVYSYAITKSVLLMTNEAPNPNNNPIPAVLYKTTDGPNISSNWASTSYPGKPINPQQGDEYPILTSIAIHPSNPDIIWVTYTGYMDEYKVWKSIDGGATWENWDPNHTLYNIPVNEIVYQKNTNDRLYIATDYGVFTRDNNSDWEKYGDELPNIRVTELKINYCTQKLRVATFGRGIWEADLQPTTHNNDVKIIAEDVTWSGNAWAESDIKVLDGVTLTITGTLNMPKNAKIIVEPGGLLKVYGGTITNNCDKMWRGIEIQGDASTSQYAANNHKGRVILSNATIENAYKAVTCYNGGILEANSSNFFNNSVSLTFYAWTNPGYYANRNKSGIQNCNFEINKEVLNNGNTFALSCIYVSNNGGKLEFKGNTFTNTNQNWTTSDLGFGITAYSSNIDVNYRCKVITQIGEECPENQRDSSEFNNLDLGIYSAAYNTSSTEINQCIFNNNHRSVNISGNLNVATITRNTFNAGNHTSDYKPYSLYLNSNTGYTIEENEFNGNIAADAGVYVYNSGSDNNQIYKNIFSGYTRSNGASAVIANRKNSNYDGVSHVGDEGLEFRCNEFNNYNGNQVKHNYAMAVVSGNIRKDQGNSGGTTTELAGNTFDQSGNNPEADLHFDARISSYYNIPHYNYYQHSTAYAQIEDYDNNKITAYTDLSTDYNENTACPSHLNTGGGTGGFDMMATKTEVEKLDAEIITEQDQLKTLVDNGNTNILLSQTETATDNNFTDVSIKVKQSEGFISDAVAKEYINSPVEQDFVKANTLIEISPLPENAKKELEKTNMNPTLKYIVSQYQNGKNIREQKELSISNKKFDRQMLIRNAIRKAVNDTLQETTDSLIQFLENRDELENKYTLVGLLTKNKNFANARNQLSKLNAIKTDYSIEKQEEITTFINLQNIVLNIAENNYSITESIVENNIAFLNTLAADSNSIFMASAWSLLEQTEKGSFTEQVVLPKANINNKSFKLEQVKPFSKHNGLEPLINIYPNPADDHITVQYAMLDKGDAVTITLNNMDGKVLKIIQSKNQVDVVTIPVSDLERGSYIVKVVSAKQGHYSVNVIVR